MGTPPVEYQFKKGNKAGVGHGRPKGSGMDKLLLKLLKKKCGVKDPETGRELTYQEAMTLRAINIATGSKKPEAALNAYFKILERTEGKTPDELNVNSAQTMDLNLGLTVQKPDDEH